MALKSLPCSFVESVIWISNWLQHPYKRLKPQHYPLLHGPPICSVCSKHSYFCQDVPKYGFKHSLLTLVLRLANKNSSLHSWYMDALCFLTIFCDVVYVWCTLSTQYRRQQTGTVLQEWFKKLESKLATPAFLFELTVSKCTEKNFPLDPCLSLWQAECLFHAVSTRDHQGSTSQSSFEFNKTKSL